MIPLKKMFHKRPDEFDEVPEGVCPNCWGNQENGNVVREKYKDLQIKVNNHSSKHDFIHDFVVTHLKGIQLKNKAKGLECPTCHIIHKDEDK